MEWLHSFTHWHWLSLGLALVVLEVLSPGIFFFWMGLAALGVGALLWLWPEIGWPMQIVAFVVFSLISILGWRRMHQGPPRATDQPALNRRGEQYVNRVFTLEQPIVNGQGKIRVDDTTWKIRGQDCVAGTQIRVIGVEGTVFLVELA